MPSGGELFYAYVMLFNSYQKINVLKKRERYLGGVSGCSHEQKKEHRFSDALPF
jgi:hypothetical protein